MPYNRLVSSKKEELKNYSLCKSLKKIDTNKLTCINTKYKYIPLLYLDDEKSTDAEMKKSFSIAISTTIP